MSTSTESYAQITREPGQVPRVHFPRRYNAAADLLDRHIEAGRGDRLAYIDERGPCTYRELWERANRAGNALRAQGVQIEQRVLLVMLDTVDFVAAFLGAMKIGAVPVPLNTLLPPEDYHRMAEDSRAVALVVSDALLPKLSLARQSPWLRAVIVSETLAGGDPEGLPTLSALSAGASADLAPAATTPDDAALWLYSSGSTGAPKGTIHLHSHLMQTAALFAQGVLRMTAEDRVFSASKLFFAYGLGNGLTFPLAVGASAVLLSGRPTPAAVLEELKTHEPSIFCCVPTLFASILASDALEGSAGSPRLRLSTSAGEALPRHVGEAWQARFGSEIIDGIGSTEMLHIFLSNRPGDVRYGTTGKPVPGYRVRLLDDSGQPVRPGEEGSLWVSGPSAAAGYFNQRDKTLRTFHGPWLRTGDRYTQDADGYYTYSGRADDMLKVGGIWVAPFEVEQALSSHEAVLEAAVVGHPDDRGLIKPKAFVVLTDPSRAGAALADALKAHVKATLAPYKYPRFIEFIDELPKTATGKIQRFKLRA